MDTSMKHQKTSQTQVDKRVREEKRIGLLAITLQRMIRLFAFGDEPRPKKQKKVKAKSVPMITGNLSQKRKHASV